MIILRYLWFILSRLVIALLPTKSLSEIQQAGNEGEEQVYSLLAREGFSVVGSRLTPSRGEKRLFGCEADIIVVVGKWVFLIEAKRLAGTLLPTDLKNSQEQRMITQINRQGKKRKLTHPVDQCKNAMTELGRFEPRLAKQIIPIACFVDFQGRLDYRAISEEGMVHISELIGYIQSRAAQLGVFTLEPDPQIWEIVQGLPTWDTVEISGEQFTGVLQENELTYRGLGGQETLLLQDVRTIQIQHGFRGWFRPSDPMWVTYSNNGWSELRRCVGGRVVLKQLKPHNRKRKIVSVTFPLRKVTRIDVGTANNPGWPQRQTSRARNH